MVTASVIFVQFTRTDALSEAPRLFSVANGAIPVQFVQTDGLSDGLRLFGEPRAVFDAGNQVQQIPQCGSCVDVLDRPRWGDS